eukprot:3129372-Rhodomonas_salina.1
MEERIRSLERERQAAEDNVHKTKRELEGKVKEMSGTLQKQEETIGQLHDSLRSVTVARDRLQSSVEVLSGEVAASLCSATHAMAGADVECAAARLRRPREQRQGGGVTWSRSSKKRW